jgi:DNA-binding SARP family transcriptional activator
MNSKVTYHQQVSYCGKPRCRRCREGIGHGPYWYAYQTVDGRTTRTYIGKQLPPDIQVELDGQREPLSAQAREREQSTIRIYTLGQFRIERRAGRNSLDWQTVTDATWQHQRVRSLLACLVSNPGRKLAREQIIDALWPDLDYETASGRLDRAVYNLRQLFEPSRNRSSSKDAREKDPHKGGLYTYSLLLTEREMITLAEHPQIWVDADVFEQLLSQAHATSDPGEKEKLLDEAMMLYSGDFLPEAEGNRLEWARTRRDSLKRNWVGMLLDLADLRAAREAYLNAIEPLDRLLSIDFTNEAAVQRLMSLLAQLGRRGEALRTYKRLVAVLQQEYRIAPLPETRSLYEAIRRGNEKGYSSLLSSPQQADSGRTGEMPVVQIGRVHQSPLVGREEEIATLRELITTVENNSRFKLVVQKRMFAASLDPQRRPQSVFLFGEVGIGKTRLAEEVSREAKKRGWAVAWSRVYAQEGGIPYRLWTEILRKAMAQGAWQRQELSNRALVFQPLNTLMPDLHIPGVSFSVPVSPEQEQLRLWEAVYELLAVISTGTPLLIALDDLQWADGSSCELLAYIARRLHGYPIVIIGTCRENELAKDHPLRSLMPDLQREMALETIPLQPLSDDQIDAIVANVPDLPRTLAERIREQAAGNPFFAEELARTFGVQPGKDLPSELNGAASVTLPETITAVLDLRLARLSQPCQQLLRKAAVLSSAFTFDLITAMEAGTSGSSEDLVLELLEEALKSGMLTEEGTGTRITYHFWHPLLANHLYEGLSAARRASLHRRAATLLIEQYRGREAEGAALITHHLEQGGADPQQIAHYAELAANRSYMLSAYPDAEKLYRIVFQYFPPEAALFEPNGMFSEEGERCAVILELLGECTRVQGKYEEACQFYEQALSLRRQQHINRASPEYQYEMQYQALLLCEIGLTYYDKGENDQAQQYYQQGEDMLRKAEVLEGPAWAYIFYRQSYVNWRKGKYNEAHRRAYEALKLFEKIVDQQDEHNNQSYNKDSLFTTYIYHILAGNPVIKGNTRMLLGLIANGSGDSAEALTHLQEALNLYEQYESQRDIAIACCNLGDVYTRRADYRQAQACFQRSLSIAEKIGEIPLVSIIFNNLGTLAERAGDLDDAVMWYDKGLSFAQQVNFHIGIAILQSFKAIVMQDLGRLEEVKSCLLQAISVSRATKFVPYIGFVLIIIGKLRIAQALISSFDESDEKSNLDVRSNLERGISSLRHALTFELEAEMRIEGRLILSRALLLRGHIGGADEQAVMALDEARKFELTWLIARAQYVLGCISAELKRDIEARQYFEQAMRTFRKTGMRLEYARTLLSYGDLLLQNEAEKQRGSSYVQEARKIFSECKAALDLRMAEQALAKCGNVIEV